MGLGRSGDLLPQQFDAEAKAIIQRVRPRTMTKPVKLYGLIEAVRYVVRHRIPGDIVECGVWRGGSMQAATLALLGTGACDRHLHLFDTFSGMPPPTERDRRHDGRTAEELLATQDRDAKVWAVASLEDVRAGMLGLGYPPDRIHFHRGLVEETIPAEAPDRIAILRLDTDWYESTKHELEHLYDRLAPGGVLILDDYGHWDGAREAVDEFLARRAEPLLLMPLATGRITIKPGSLS
jgi:O-methyltransferase